MWIGTLICSSTALLSNLTITHKFLNVSCSFQFIFSSLKNSWDCYCRKVTNLQVSKCPLSAHLFTLSFFWARFPKVLVKSFMINVSVNGNGCFLTQCWHSLINANIKMPFFHWSGSVMGPQASTHHWTVRHEAQATWQRLDVRPGFESRGNQLCEVALMTGECVTAVLV